MKPFIKESCWDLDHHIELAKLSIYTGMNYASFTVYNRMIQVFLFTPCYKLTVPAVGPISAVSKLSVVLFPAPFGPNIPNTSPG